MANIPSSMSRSTGISEGLLPEAPKVARVVPSQAKPSTNFQKHLEEPPAKAALVQAQKQTNGATRSDASAQKSVPEKKPALTRDSKTTNPKEQRSIDMNPKKAPLATAVSEKYPMGPSAPAPKEDAAQAAEPALDSKPETMEPTKPVKSQLTGVTEETKETDDNDLGRLVEGASVLVVQAEDIPVEGQAILDTSAFDAKATEGESWQNRLEDMLMYMGIAPQTLQKDLPSLAILTGQLENIAPASIPNALADSPLLNNVLASADPEAVIEEVKPLGLWLDEMGWSPDGLVVKDPEAFQELMNTPVSLKDVMKTFKVDVDRVVTEAKVLQATLPLEGAAPYIARASSIQMESDPPADRPIKGAERETNNSRIKPELLAILNGRGMASQDPTVAPSLKEVPVKAPESLNQLRSLDQIMTAIGSPILAASDGLPKATLAQENPFQTMELTARETFTFTEATPIDAAPMSKSDRQSWLENIQAFQLQTEGLEPNAPEKSRGFNPEILIERMGQLSLASLGDSPEGRDQGGEDFLSEGGTDASPANASQGTQKSQNTFELGTAETQKAQPTNLVQKAVIENAQMLVKDGGGAIRIDIGNKETGSIDLAVEVKDDKVEVKISAASPEARQLLAQELPKLRELLQNQNLNLSKVEVGLSGGSSWTSSDGQSSRRESSTQSDELAALNGRISRESSKSYSRISSSQANQPSVTREGGGIKVRV